MNIAGYPMGANSSLIKGERDRTTLPGITHPRDLLPIREAIMAALPKRMPENGTDWLHWAMQSDTYQMYFARPDFADLYAEMRASLTWEHGVKTYDLLRDIVAEHGDHGAILMAFDDRHAPMIPMRFSKSPAMDMVFGKDDDRIEERETAIAWMCLYYGYTGGEDYQATAMIVPNRFESTTGLDTEDATTTNYAIIAAWMMLTAQTKNLTTQAKIVAGQGLPPKAKKALGLTKTAKTPITIVDLRRTVRSDLHAVSDAEKRHLDHRFIVRSHWRKQAVGVGRKDRRMTFVAAYIKGPEDAPFVKREKVSRY